MNSVAGASRLSAFGRRLRCVSARAASLPEPVRGRAAAGGFTGAVGCAGCPAMLGFMACRKTLFVRCAHCAQTDATSQMTKRANTRAAMKPVLLGTPEAPPAAARPRTGDPRPKRAQWNWILRRPRMVRKAMGWHALACVCGGEERRLGVGARPRALRDLTCGSLFERSERSERSDLCRTTPRRAPQRTLRSRAPQAHASACRPRASRRNSHAQQGSEKHLSPAKSTAPDFQTVARQCV